MLYPTKIYIWWMILMNSIIISVISYLFYDTFLQIKQLFIKLTNVTKAALLLIIFVSVEPDILSQFEISFLKNIR